MHDLLNVMNRQAEMASGRNAKTRIGIVTSYDPNYYAAKVTIQPEGTPTGWLPVLSQWVGRGWGLVSPPSVGDQVLVLFQENDREAGVIGLRFFNDQDRPPGPCPSGEFWLIHKTGSLLQFHNDGSVDVKSAGDLRAVVGGNLTATVTGNVVATVSGALTATVAGTAAIYAAAIRLGAAAGDTLKRLVTETFVALFNSHTHGGIQTGSGHTAVPDQLAGAAHETSIVTAE